MLSQFKQTMNVFLSLGKLLNKTRYSMFMVNNQEKAMVGQKRRGA